MCIRKQILTIFTIIFASTAFAATAAAQTYESEAAAAKVVLDTSLTSRLETGVLATGPIAANGGNTSLSTVGLSVAGGLLTVGSSTADASAGNPGGNPNSSQSSASVNTLGITVLGIPIGADVVQSNSMCACGGAICAGGSNIVNLRVGGDVVTVSGLPNQTVDITVAGIANVHIVINEQIISPGSITVNALHISVTALSTLVTTDVIVSPSHAGIDCPEVITNNLYRGRSYGLWVGDNVLLNSGVTAIAADTGYLPTSGGLTSVSSVALGLPPLLGNATVTSNTSGGPAGGSALTTQSDTRVENLVINVPLLLPVRIGANVLQANTVCSCSSTVPTCNGSSTLTGLTVTVGAVNIPVNISGNPNQHLELDLLGLATLILDINNQTRVGQDRITQEALRIGLRVAGVTDLKVVAASSHSGIHCGLAPSAAPISVSGTVRDQFGNGIKNVVVSINGSDGTPVSVRTNMFGNYVFHDLEQGEIYVLSARHKAYRFTSQVVSSTDDVTGLDITAMSDQDKASRR